MTTWSTRTPIVTRDVGLLPRAADSNPTEPADPAWAERIDDLLALRQLDPDWDGQGSAAPAVSLVDSALVFALLLRQAGFAAPSGVMPGVAADVIFDWHGDGGKYTEIRITQPYLAELFAHAPGTPVRHLVIRGETREAAA